MTAIARSAAARFTATVSSFWSRLSRRNTATESMDFACPNLRKEAGLPPSY